MYNTTQTRPDSPLPSLTYSPYDSSLSPTAALSQHSELFQPYRFLIAEPEMIPQATRKFSYNSVKEDPSKSSRTRVKVIADMT